MATAGTDPAADTAAAANAENDSAVSNSNNLTQILDDNSKPSDCKIAKTISDEQLELVATSTEYNNNPAAAATRDCTSSPAIIADDNNHSTKSIAVKVIYNKKKFDVNVDCKSSIAELKKQLHVLVGVPDSMQKLMYKGLLQDKHSIVEAGIQEGAKIMLVGSTLTDILSVSSLSKEDMRSAGGSSGGDSADSSNSPASATKEPLCKQKLHRKVLDKGVPEDVMTAVDGDVHSPLPSTPLSGMLNRHGGKVRLTFKLESDQLWLSTKERTEKVAMGGIKAVVSEPIEGHTQYHMVGLQLGTTEASRYWLYWVPAQYVQAIKHAILGQWQML